MKVMKFAVVGSVAVSAALIVSACQKSPTASDSVADESAVSNVQMMATKKAVKPAKGPAPKVDVCHVDGGGRVRVINISSNALDAHLAHGDALPATFYADADGDGYGDASSSVTACAAPDGYVENSDDCDDSDSAVNPGADEVCGDGIDNDCAGGDETCAPPPNPCVLRDIGPGAECYWLGHTPQGWCWQPATWVSGGTNIGACQNFDSCSSNGGGASGGGCYRWAEDSHAPSIAPVNGSW